MTVKAVKAACVKVPLPEALGWGVDGGSPLRVLRRGLGAICDWDGFKTVYYV
ncbi:hypothetical protein [Pyrobaculum aerophilum]|uniref:hypothetical protein n=1 Tax=Pyrobaculum aerophilum TaxID=13773 RepID=UPI0015F25F2A|nr:hypothetical protein [Pyrobaculum aerophilum]